MRTATLQNTLPLSDSPASHVSAADGRACVLACLRTHTHTRRPAGTEAWLSTTWARLPTGDRTHKCAGPAVASLLRLLCFGRGVLAHTLPYPIDGQSYCLAYAPRQKAMLDFPENLRGDRLVVFKTASSKHCALA